MFFKRKSHIPEGALSSRFSCKTPCEIFTGRNALRHAIYWCETGRDCKDPHKLFNMHEQGVRFNKACSWNEGETAIPSRTTIEGDGVHAKMFEYGDYLIFGSQNNGSSPLFETAIVFKKKERLFDFFSKSFKRAAAYQKWWRKNKTY